MKYGGKRLCFLAFVWADPVQMEVVTETSCVVCDDGGHDTMRWYECGENLGHLRAVYILSGTDITNEVAIEQNSFAKPSRSRCLTHVRRTKNVDIMKKRPQAPCGREKRKAATGNLQLQRESQDQNREI